MKFQSPKPNTTFSPTLARLLTAPERGIHSVKHANVQNNSGKIHNNGEITITPIAVAQNGPKVDFGSLVRKCLSGISILFFFLKIFKFSRGLNLIEVPVYSD